MKVICPYTESRRYLVNSLIAPIIKREGIDCEFITMNSDDDYWKLMCGLWEQREPLVINEHDVLPWPGAIQALFDCPYHWCSYTYEMKGGYGIHHGLGCTKFTTKFMENFPDVWINVDTTMWNTLDAQLSKAARFDNFYPHPHNPPVTHLKGIEL